MCVIFEFEGKTHTSHSTVLSFQGWIFSGFLLIVLLWIAFHSFLFHSSPFAPFIYSHAVLSYGAICWPLYCKRKFDILSGFELAGIIKTHLDHKRYFSEPSMETSRLGYNYWSLSSQLRTRTPQQQEDRKWNLNLLNLNASVNSSCAHPPPG